MIGIEAAYNRCFTPRFALAHHHAGTLVAIRFSAQARSMPRRGRWSLTWGMARSQPLTRAPARRQSSRVWWPLARVVSRSQSTRQLRVGPLKPRLSQFQLHQSARPWRFSRRSQTAHRHSARRRNRPPVRCSCGSLSRRHAWRSCVNVKLQAIVCIVLSY